MPRIAFSTTCLSAALLLAGCMETMPRPERPRPPRPGPDRPIACTQEYAPVCAAKGWNRKTFGNACMARGQGYKVISDRPCDQRAQ
jgi:hypothetical protein